MKIEFTSLKEKLSTQKRTESSCSNLQFKPELKKLHKERTQR